MFPFFISKSDVIRQKKVCNSKMKAHIVQFTFHVLAQTDFLVKTMLTFLLRKVEYEGAYFHF